MLSKALHIRSTLFARFRTYILIITIIGQTNSLSCEPFVISKVGRIGLKDLKNPENPHFLDLELGFEILSEGLDCFDKKSNSISNPQSLLVRTKNDGILMNYLAPKSISVVNNTSDNIFPFEFAHGSAYHSLSIVRIQFRGLD